MRQARDARISDNATPPVSAVRGAARVIFRGSAVESPCAARKPSGKKRRRRYTRPIGINGRKGIEGRAIGLLHAKCWGGGCSFSFVWTDVLTRAMQ